MSNAVPLTIVDITPVVGRTHLAALDNGGVDVLTSA